MGMVNIRVQVTEEDIKQGTHTFDRCPVALALRRITGKAAWIGEHTGDYIGPHHVVLPQEAKNWIDEFDYAMHLPAPFEFTMQVPEELMFHE